MAQPSSALASFLAGNPAVAARFDALNAVTPALSAGQSAAFQAGQALQDGIRDAEASIAGFDVEVRSGARAPSAPERTRLRAVAAAARSAHAAAGIEVTKLTDVSYGTRKALERTIAHATGIANANGEVTLVKPSTLKGSPLAIIGSQRRVLEELDDEAATIRGRLQPAGDTLARAMAELTALSQRGRVNVAASGELLLPQTVIEAAPAFGSTPVKIVDTGAMLAALNFDALVAQIEARVEAMYAGVSESAQLTGDQKKAALKDIEAKRFEAELIEVQAVFACWQMGRTNIGLRADTSPRAILGIRDWKAGPPRWVSPMISEAERRPLEVKDAVGIL